MTKWSHDQEENETDQSKDGEHGSYILMTSTQLPHKNSIIRICWINRKDGTRQRQLGSLTESLECWNELSHTANNHQCNVHEMFSKCLFWTIFGAIFSYNPVIYPAAVTNSLHSGAQFTRLPVCNIWVLIKVFTCSAEAIYVGDSCDG